GREGKGREGKGREGKGREGKGREKGREGKGREGKGREGKGREGKGREGKGREGKGKGREGKGREGKGRKGRRREGKGREGKGREGKGREGKGREGEGKGRGRKGREGKGREGNLTPPDRSFSHTVRGGLFLGRAGHSHCPGHPLPTEVPAPASGQRHLRNPLGWVADLAVPTALPPRAHINPKVGASCHSHVSHLSEGPHHPTAISMAAAREGRKKHRKMEGWRGVNTSPALHPKPAPLSCNETPLPFVLPAPHKPGRCRHTSMCSSPGLSCNEPRCSFPIQAIYSADPPAKAESHQRAWEKGCACDGCIGHLSKIISSRGKGKQQIRKKAGEQGEGGRRRQRKERGKCSLKQARVESWASAEVTQKVKRSCRARARTETSLLGRTSHVASSTALPHTVSSAPYL
ncbi:unnamed protein product, partial [Bubo scandiacus]